MYKIEKYNIKNRTGVTHLLTDLWGGIPTENLKIFESKYEKNPYDNKIYAIVALYNDEVVGFRGFIPSKWQMSEEIFWFLLVADANVHKEHRRKGLFQKMNQKALELFQDSKFNGYLNLTSNKFSSPGYLKLGWKSICKEDYHRLTGLKSLILWKLNFSRKSKNKNKSIKVINTLNRKDVDRILAIEKNIKNKWQISEKNKLYGYKLLRNNYSCFIYSENGKILSYATITTNGSLCTIIDYEYKSLLALMTIIRELKKHFHVVSIWNISSRNENLKKSMLSKWIERREKKDKNDILFRPIDLNLTEESFYINGKDVLDSNVWNLKQICAE